MIRTVRVTLIAALAALAALAAGCTSTAPKSPGSTPSSSPAQAQSGQVGDKLTVAGRDSKYDVTLLSVDQQAQPESEFLGPKASHHLAAAQFRVAAITSTDENSNLNATATGSNDESFSSSLLPVTAGTNFASGSIKLQPGSNLVGWVSFEVPDGVQITKVQWTPHVGLSANRAEWKVNKSVTSSPGPTSTSAAPSAPSPTSAPTPGSPPGAGTPGPTTSPESTVRAYFDAINLRDYQKAWALGGKNTGTSYSSFVSGFNDTSMVSVQIQGISGDVVTAQLNTLEKSGSTKTFRGTYTVQGGVITKFNVRQVS